MNISFQTVHLGSNGMLPVLTSDSMREADRITVEDYGISVQTLMELAGRACAESALRMLEDSGGVHVSIVCGKGNNGGDGYAAARILALHGKDVDVFSVASADDLSPEAAHQYRLLKRLAKRHSRLRLLSIDDPSTLGLHPTDLWVDAILGTGVTNQVRSRHHAIIESISESRARVLSVDIPSGLHAEEGIILGAAIKADVTVIMGALKIGMLRNAGPAQTGRVEVAEIGIPVDILERGAAAFLTTDHAVRNWLPIRPRDAHKYSAGMTLVIGGSVGMTGAVVMSAQAAARAGAGYVAVATPRDAQQVVASHLVAETTIGLDQAGDGGILLESALTDLEPWLRKADSVVIGPGLGRAQSTIDFVLNLLPRLNVPTVIDADALFALSTAPDALRSMRSEDFLLTPHMGEFERLIGKEFDLNDSAGLAEDFVGTTGCTLILKGTPTLVVTPGDPTVFSGTGNPALATAGTGDVLSGLCGALLASGLSPSVAGAAAVHIGGAVADTYTEKNYGSAMIATDMVRLLPEVLHNRFVPM